MLPELKAPRDDMKIKRVDDSPTDRRPCNVSLGPIVVTAAEPHPDQYDTEMLVAGLIKRVAFKHPKADSQTLQKFALFVSHWVEENFVPLDPATDISVSTWLNETDYPFWRKQELLGKLEKVVDEFDEKYKTVKCFAKDEPYPEFKYLRNIFARTDEFKCFVGPYFKAIEKQVYKHPSFVKHVSVKNRPGYVLDILNGGGSINSTDYSAFESQFNRLLMEICEVTMYRYMTQHLPTREIFYRHLKTIDRKSVV